VRRLSFLSPQVVRRAIVLGTVSLALASVVGGCGDQAAQVTEPIDGLNFGAFSGYQLLGRVASVAGTITVPRVVPGSEFEIAGTWVGAEAIGEAREEPFIQVGVNEVGLGKHFKGISVDAQDRAAYYVFWSDTANHFHPIPLFRVRPGDRVVTRLALRERRWEITVTDGRIRRSFTTAQEGHGVFQAALWAQEDVTENTRTMRLAPYPDVASPEFGSLLVNGSAPTQASLNATWMSARGRILRPTPLRNDGFSLIDNGAALNARATRFLKSIATATSKVVKPTAELYGLTAKTSRKLIARWASRVAVYLTGTARLLGSEHWSGKASSAAVALAQTSRRAAALTNAIRNEPPSDYKRWLSRWSAAVNRNILDTARLLRTLRLPEIPHRET
jgi:hypothetical protein